MSDIFSSFEAFADAMPSVAVAPVPNESESEFDGKCLHCDHFLPFPKNPERGQCLRKASTRHGGETCSAYIPNKPEPENPWGPDAGYFEIAPRVHSQLFFRQFALLHTCSTHEIKRARGHIGAKFHHLEVIAETDNPARVRCRCECGNEIEANIYNLALGHRRSCGCLNSRTLSRKKFERFRGTKFGKLTVLEIKPAPKGTRKPAKYVCRCDCGNIVEVNNTNLTHGTRMCRKCVDRITHERHVAKINARTGEKIGNWTLEGFSHCGFKYGLRKNFVFVRCCDCGARAVVLNTKHAIGHLRCQCRQ